MSFNINVRFYDLEAFGSPFLAYIKGSRRSRGVCYIIGQAII